MPAMQQPPDSDPTADPAAAMGDTTNAPGDTSRDYIAVVSGLPRSGTSLMMQMLVAGGLPALSDDRRAADESNPRGYLEHEAVKRLKDDATLLDNARGRCVKVIHALLRHLPPAHAYRVVFMQRDIDEVVRSQAAMLERDGKAGAKLSAAQLTAVFARQRDEALAWIARQPNMTLLEVDHREAVTQPQAVAGRVDTFLGGGLDTDAMAACADASLYRSKATGT